jgi:hypothetical protein
VPVNSGSRPGAPLGGHSTKLPLPADPVDVAAPAVAAPPPRVAPPLPAAPPPVAPDPPEAVLVLPPVRPVVPVPEAAPVLPPALPAVVPVVELVKDDVVVPVVGVDVVVPAVGVLVVVDEFCMVGKAAAPPPAGNPLRSVALPTPPPVGAAVCASADETRAIDRKRANPELRIMANT